MKKSIVAGLLVILIILFSCASTIVITDNEVNETKITGKEKNVTPLVYPANSFGKFPPLKPHLTHYVYKVEERIHFPDGRVGTAEFNIKIGKKLFTVVIISVPISSPLPKGGQEINHQYDTIIEMIDQEIYNNPKNIQAYISRAGAYFERGGPGDLDYAIGDCNTVLSMNDSVEAAYYIRGMASAAKGDIDQSIRDMNKIMELREYNTIGIRYLLARFYIEEDNILMAINELESVISIDPDFLDAKEVLEVLSRR